MTADDYKALFDEARAAASGFTRCCDCLQDGFGTVACYECMSKTFAMLYNVQCALGVSTKAAEPLNALNWDREIRRAQVRNHASALHALLQSSVSMVDVLVTRVTAHCINPSQDHDLVRARRLMSEANKILSYLAVAPNVEKLDIEPAATLAAARDA